MSQVERASRWLYRGVWAVLVDWFRVPKDPPSLPVAPGEAAQSFQPAPGFLSLLKLQFWIVLAIIDGAILFAWAVITIASPIAGAILLLPALVVAILPDILAYIAIHLRYDTTWYVLTNRSLRIRRGIWVIHETTITFENVQNITVNQGPVQRFFGIADVLVETAGGGGAQQAQQHGQAAGGAGHRGLIEGVANAQQIRDLILARIKHTGATGLGEEPEHEPRAAGWTAEHIAVLREIRQTLESMAARPSSLAQG